MTGFDDRQKAYEKRFVQDEEKIFKIRARRRKFLGLWAGEQMHMSEEECLEYAVEVVKFGVGNSVSVDDIAQKVFNDIKSKNVDVTIEEVQSKMDILMEKAVQSLEKEGVI